MRSTCSSSEGRCSADPSIRIRCWAADDWCRTYVTPTCHECKLFFLGEWKSRVSPEGLKNPRRKDMFWWRRERSGCSLAAEDKRVTSPTVFSQRRWTGRQIGKKHQHQKQPITFTGILRRWQTTWARLWLRLYQHTRSQMSLVFALSEQRPYQTRLQTFHPAFLTWVHNDAASLPSFLTGSPRLTAISNPLNHNYFSMTSKFCGHGSNVQQIKSEHPKDTPEVWIRPFFPPRVLV